MDFLIWLFKNFGFLFAPAFMLYLFLIIRRLTILYDYIRHIPGEVKAEDSVRKSNLALVFLDKYFEHLRDAVTTSHKCVDAIIDAIWAEMDCRITIHFTALNGYANTLIQLGFAGTILGSIGAFNAMFQGLNQGEAPINAFVASWDAGLATALYTSFASAMIGGMLLTLICSDFFLKKAKQLESMVSIRISEIIKEEIKKGDNVQKAA